MKEKTKEKKGKKCAKHEGTIIAQQEMLCNQVLGVKHHKVDICEAAQS